MRTVKLRVALKQLVTLAKGATALRFTCRSTHCLDWTGRMTGTDRGPPNPATGTSTLAAAPPHDPRPSFQSCGTAVEDLDAWLTSTACERAY